MFSRLPDVVVGGLRFYRDSSSIFYLLSIIFRQLPFELPEWNSTKTGHILGSECDLKMHVRILGYPLPIKSGAQNHPFRRLRNLTANLTAYIFRMKHDIHNRASVLETTRGVLRLLKMSWTLVHKRPKIGPKFLPTLRKFCTTSLPGFADEAQQTELNQTLPNGGSKSR